MTQMNGWQVKGEEKMSMSLDPHFIAFLHAHIMTMKKNHYCRVFCIRSSLLFGADQIRFVRDQHNGVRKTGEFGTVLQ